MALDLSPLQEQALRFIAGHLQAKGYSPSFEDVRRALDLSSKSHVARLIDALERKHLLRRLPYRHRAMEVLGTPTLPRAPDGAPLHAVPFREAC